MAIAVSMKLPAPDGAELNLEYLDSNKRITKVNWLLPAGVVGRMRIFANGDLIYDRAEGGPASGSESVPGLHTMELITPPVEEGDPYWFLPSYLTYIFTIQTIN